MSINIINLLLNKYNPVDEVTLKKYYDNDNKVNFPWIISLDKDKNKYINTFKKLKLLKFDPIKFKAIYGKNIKINEPKIYSKFNNLSEGEIGCFLSHLLIYYIASKHKNKNQYTLIFEDDINTFINEESINKNINDAISHNTNMIYLGKCLEICEKVTKISENIYYGHKPLCLHAYLIKNSFAKKIIEGLNEYERKSIDFPIDWYLHQYTDNKKTLIFHPSLFFQSTEYQSNLRSKKEQYANLLECQESIYYVVIDYFFKKMNKYQLILFGISIILLIILIIKLVNGVQNKI